MKDSEPQELKPVYIQETSFSSNDEINMVDIALVLVRRKKIIAVITIFIILLGTITALSKPRTYTFSTSIEIGSQIIGNKIEPFEPAQTLLAKIQYSFIPLTLNEQRGKNPGKKERYNIKTRIPRSSSIIVLEINSTEDKADLMISLLQNVTHQAIQDHKRAYDSIRQNLEALVAQAEKELAAHGTRDNQVEKWQGLKGEIEIHESKLANLRKTREILPPMRSIDPTGTSRKRFVIISAFAGIFVAVFTAFFVEFAGRVKEKNRS